MKKILFIILFIFSQNVFTQNIKGMMVLNDGSKLEGFFKISLNKFVYRKNKDSKIEKFGYKEAKYLLLDNEDGTYSKFEFISVKDQKKPILFNVMIEDNLSLYSQVLISPNSVTKVGTVSSGLVVRYTSTYYVKRKDEKLIDVSVNIVKKILTKSLPIMLSTKPLEITFSG